MTIIHKNIWEPNLFELNRYFFETGTTALCSPNINYNRTEADYRDQKVTCGKCIDLSMNHEDFIELSKDGH